MDVLAEAVAALVTASLAKALPPAATVLQPPALSAILTEAQAQVVATSETLVVAKAVEQPQVVVYVVAPGAVSDSGIDECCAHEVQGSDTDFEK